MSALTSDIVFLRKKGHTLEEIGKIFGVTKQAISQRLQRYSNIDPYNGRVTCSQAVELLGISHKAIWDIAGSCGVRFHRYGKKCTLLDEEMIARVREAMQDRPLCRICKRKVPMGRRVFCSSECRKTAWSYAYWSLDRRKKHREIVLRLRQKEKTP